jgi:WD40 repeat protein
MGVCLRTLGGHGKSVTSVVFSASARYLASGSADKTVKIWDAATGVCIQTLEGHANWVIWVAFSADERRLASGSADEKVKIWDLARAHPSGLSQAREDDGWVNLSSPVEQPS